MLNLKIERNLEGDISHSVPDWCVMGALSSVFTVSLTSTSINNTDIFLCICFEC